MKKISIVLLFSCFISCNSNTKTVYQKKPPDTTKTLALYVNQQGSVSGDSVFRITKDTSYLDTSNQDQVNLRFKRDTSYYVPTVFYLTDSLGKPIVDSLGKTKTTIRYMFRERKFIKQDYN